jgi:hypothetical protein
MTEKSLTLKEEYAKKKAQEQAVAYYEAKQLLEAYYLIAEKLDTATISQIVDAMTGVESALGEFIPPLNSIKAGLDAAEAELTNLISGKAGNDPKKTSAMLGKAMGFFQGLSEFLRQDLPVLLKSRMMSNAKNNPDQPVGANMAPAFQQALAINKQGGFLKRLFSSSDIPYINNAQAAQELTQLTWNQLDKLTKVGKIPAVLPQAQIDQMAAQASGEAPASGRAGTPVSTQGQTQATSGGAATAPGGGLGQKIHNSLVANLKPYMGDNIPDELLTKLIQGITTALKT